MDLKKILAKHGVESAELLADLQAGIDNMDSIPKTRFNEVIKQRNEAKADLAEKESQLSSLEEKVKALRNERKELAEYKTKWETAESERLASIKEEWAEKSKIFEIDETDKRFDTVKSLRESFVFAQEGEELSKDQLLSNIKQMRLLEKANVFEVKEEHPDYDRGKGKGTNTQGSVKNPYVSMFKKK